MVLAGNTMSEDEEIRDNLVRLKNWKKHKLTALEKEREDLEKIKNDSVCTPLSPLSRTTICKVCKQQ